MYFAFNYSNAVRLRLWLALYLFICQSLHVSSMSSGKTLKLASFNIRFGGPRDPAESEKRSQNSDQERPWHERREGLVDQVIWEEPDIMGFQEVGLNFMLHICLQPCHHRPLAGAQ